MGFHFITQCLDFFHYWAAFEGNVTRRITANHINAFSLSKPHVLKLALARRQNKFTRGHVLVVEQKNTHKLERKATFGMAVPLLRE